MTVTTMTRRGIALGVMLAGAVAFASALASPLAAQRVAQSAAPDARWQGWLGCWQPVSPASGDSYTEWMATRARDAGMPTLCIVPSTTPTAVDFVTVAAGAVTAREAIDAANSHAARTRDGCDGWEGANWSADGRRIYLRSEYNCASGAAQSSSGLLTMSPNGQLLDIRETAVAGSKAVRIARYQSVRAPAGFSLDSTRVMSTESIPVAAARAGIAGTISSADIVDAVHNADSLVVEAWLVERGERFNVDAKHLVALADAGVPGRITDLMIALSYPNAFAFDRSTRASSALGVTGSRAHATMPLIDPFGYSSGAYGYPYGYGPLGYDQLRYGNPYGYGYGRGYGYGYGNGYGGYTYQPPVVIVRGSGGTTGHGRVVNGRGYQRDPSGSTATQPTSGAASTGSANGSGSSGASSSGTSTSAGSSSSGSGGTRHAQPKP